MLRYPLASLLAVLVVGFAVGWYVGRTSMQRYQIEVSNVGLAYRLDRQTGQAEIIRARPVNAP